MMIGERLRSLREEKKMSQGVIENRTGLLRAYVSRVENGHTVPAIETLEKFARALEVPIYQLFFGVGEHPEIPQSAKRAQDPKLWGNSGKDYRTLGKVHAASGEDDAGTAAAIAEYRAEDEQEQPEGQEVSSATFAKAYKARKAILLFRRDVLPCQQNPRDPLSVRNS